MKMQKKNNLRIFGKGAAYPQKQNFQITDFQNIEHQQHYSSSSRGAMGIDHSFHSLSPHHTKVPSNNSGYNTTEIEWGSKGNFKINNSSRNSRKLGNLDQLNTDPAVFQQEGHNSRNKYTNRMMTNNYNDQRNTYDTGNQMLVKNSSTGSSGSKMHHKGYEGNNSASITHQKMNVRNSQRMFQSSDVDETRKHTQNANYDSPNSGNGVEHQSQILKKNYQKFVEKNYRSGSGSTSGGTSIEGIQYMKNMGINEGGGSHQYYTKPKLNVSDITEQNVQSMHEDDSKYVTRRRHTGNRNSRDQQYINSDNRKLSDIHLEENKIMTHGQEAMHHRYRMENEINSNQAHYCEFLLEMDRLDSLISSAKENSPYNLENSSISQSEQEGLSMDTVQNLINCLSKIQDFMQRSPMCSQLTEYFVEHEGLSLLMKAFDYIDDRDLKVVELLLQIINVMCDYKDNNNLKYKERIFLAGFLHYILKFGGVQYPKKLRMELAYFLGLIFIPSAATKGQAVVDPVHVKMVIGAGGLPVLTNFIDQDYEDNTEMIFVAIDAFNHLYQVDFLHKVDISNTLIRHQIFERIMTIVDYLLTLYKNPKEGPYHKYFERAIDLLVSIASQPSVKIKQVMCDNNLMSVFLKF